MKTQSVNYPLLLIVTVVTCGLALLGIKRLDIDTDIVKSLPAHEQVIADALEIFKNHPIHDQVAVDIMIDRNDPDLLVDCSTFLQARMQASGLFSEVGMAEIGGQIPELANQIVRDLPQLFSKKELNEKIAPRLQRDVVHQRLQGIIEGMGGLEGIGQSAFISVDPLGIKDLVLAKLIHLAPSPHATFYKGNLISKDGRHLLLSGRPVTAGTDTATARKLAELFTTAGNELSQKYASSGAQVTLTPVGGFRAALDNEEIIRHDVQLALGLTTVGIALLLFFAFPRPLFGLLSLVPPVAGTAAALFVYSLFSPSISIMVLGFSGALISIMDDHSITYLLFLDRPHATKGEHAAREVQSVGGPLVLFTTLGAFIVLSFSGFPVFAELGKFTALGFLFTYLFIHFICPKLFPDIPSAGNRVLPLHNLARMLFNTGKPGAVAALLLALVLLFFAKPEFHISLSAMNTVSDKTLAADRLFSEVWGDIGQKVYLMNKAASMQELQQHNDNLLTQLDKDMQLQRIHATFSPSMIFPGQERSRENLMAWRNFWTNERKDQVKEALVREGTSLGFKAEAFDAFFALLDPPQSMAPQSLSSRYNNLLGISAQKNGELIQFVTITPGKEYDAPQFFNDYGRNNRIFDANYFSVRLGDILFSTFTSMLIIIAVLMTLLLFLQFLSWQLTIITLLPLIFAFICTLGTLKLIGHPLDIPGLMLSVVILGMGVDYPIYAVCGCQFYGSTKHPSHVLLRGAILMAAASTIIGFGVLCLTKHSTLRSVGITSLCGIGYSLLGTFLILPPFLQAYFESKDENKSRHRTLIQRILWRYRLLEAYPRMFARCKLKFDPLFNELSGMLKLHGEIREILDIGCGYGVPACWCLENYPEARVIGIDPEESRVRIAGLATGIRGTIIHGAAPGLPAVTAPVDVVLLLDMLHYLDDQQVQTTLERCSRLLSPGGILVIRCVTARSGRHSISWYYEDFRIRIAGNRPYYRTAGHLEQMLSECGLAAVRNMTSLSNDELTWLVGQNGKKGQ